MSINNFLTSGYHFQKNEYEEKLHYYLFNSILLFVIIMLSILAYVRFVRGETTQIYIDISVIVVSIISIFLLRKSKKYERPITITLLIVFFLLVSETFLEKNAYLVGASWYILFLLSAYFLGGKILGLIATVSSFLAIIILGNLAKNSYDIFDYLYVLMPFAMSVIFIILYEKRNLYAKQLLLKKNISLEIEIEKKILEKIKLSKQSKELANIIEKSDIELYIVDFDSDNYLYINNGVIKELGYKRNELLKMNVYDINPHLTSKDVKKLKKSIENSSSKSVNYITKHRRKNGEEYTAQASIFKIKFNNKNAYAIYDINITEREKAQEELLHQRNLLNHQAYHDSLTNLPNRALFLDRISQSLHKAKRHKESFAVLFIDLDQFKQINDSFGHETGDLVIQNVAKRFMTILRKSDTFARLGGDEFTIIAQEIKIPNDAAILAQKLIQSLQDPFLIEKHELYITCSIGISLYPQDAKQTDLLVRNADTAMYKAKENGRNTYNFYTTDMTKSAFERVVLETSLRNAISKDEFIVYYQPQYNIKTDKILGIEALVRWKHPQAGLIQPYKFIPLAEENGMIIDIDKLTARKAMLQYIKWKKSGYSPGKLNLNLTIMQLMHKSFFKDLKINLSEIKFDPKWLSFEITESQIMTNPKVAIDKLLLLNDMGIEISIDDFGTGYSSLSYLKKLPINQLKIDKSFIDEIPTDNESSSIVKTIIVLSKILNLQIIAEGVESVEQKNFLLENGCNNIQGYLYSKPLDTNDMTQLLSKESIS